MIYKSSIVALKLLASAEKQRYEILGKLKEIASRLRDRIVVQASRAVFEEMWGPLCDDHRRDNFCVVCYRANGVVVHYESGLEKILNGCMLACAKSSEKYASLIHWSSTRETRMWSVKCVFTGVFRIAGETPLYSLFARTTTRRYEYLRLAATTRQRIQSFSLDTWDGRKKFPASGFADSDAFRVLFERGCAVSRHKTHVEALESIAKLEQPDVESELRLVSLKRREEGRHRKCMQVYSV